MANEKAQAPGSSLDIKSVLAELEVPFSPDQIQWRVTNTAKDKRRGQIVPYANPRAYADRLNALFTPQGWTREYKIETMSNITRMKKGESIVSGKILVTCTVTIFGLSSHSGTSEEWADWRVGPDPGILDWYTVIGGVVALMALALHGALYLAVKTEGALQQRCRSAARILGNWIAVAYDCEPSSFRDRSRRYAIRRISLARHLR